MNEITATSFDSFMKNIAPLQNIAQDMLQQAKKLGASEAEVGLAASKGFSVTARDHDVETIEYHLDKTIDITVYFDKHSGSASISDFQPEAVQKAVAAACHIAKFTGEDTASGLANKEDLAFDYPHLQLYYPWQLSVEQAIAIACECEKVARDHNKHIMGAEPASVGTMESLQLYANSHGFMGYYPHTHHEISCVLVAKKNDEMQRDHGYSISIDPQKLASAKTIATIAAERTMSRLGARRLRTMKAPVLFIAEEARGLIKYFLAGILGGNIYRQSSFLLNAVGKKIFPEFVHIEEQPFLPFGLGSAPFDSEGVATRNNVFIENGVLQQYCLSSYSARKLNLKTTGNADGVHNLIIKPGQNDLKSLLKKMNRGLLVTEMMGNGVNIVTGDYSKGAAGFWVENGEIQYPVHEITIAGNLHDMFLNMVEIGNDVDVRGNLRTGSILISEMMIAGE